jgi:hypothetical protein
MRQPGRIALAGIASAFQMPAAQTMISRKSSITNAFVNAVIPAVQPTLKEIEEALSILGLDPNDLRCAYCGDASTEWDHLRPLVLNRRPTGYISEIANLVPACGKCNQSKGNKPWRSWMLSQAPRSPTARNVGDVSERICRLETFEQWRQPTQVDFLAAVEPEDWERYWSLCEAVNSELRRAQDVAEEIRVKIAHKLKAN